MAHLYIMSRSCAPGVFKVGRSDDPDRRANDLMSGHFFKMSVHVVYREYGYLETQVHSLLKNWRKDGPGPGREWFVKSLPFIVTTIAQAMQAQLEQDQVLQAEMLAKMNAEDTHKSVPMDAEDTNESPENTNESPEDTNETNETTDVPIDDYVPIDAEDEAVDHMPNESDSSTVRKLKLASLIHENMSPIQIKHLRLVKRVAQKKVQGKRLDNHEHLQGLVEDIAIWLAQLGPQKHNGRSTTR